MVKDKFTRRYLLFLIVMLSVAVFLFAYAHQLRKSNHILVEISCTTCAKLDTLLRRAEEVKRHADWLEDNVYVAKDILPYAKNALNISSLVYHTYLPNPFDINALPQSLQ